MKEEKRKNQTQINVFRHEAKDERRNREKWHLRTRVYAERDDDDETLSPVPPGGRTELPEVPPPAASSSSFPPPLPLALAPPFRQFDARKFPARRSGACSSPKNAVGRKRPLRVYARKAPAALPPPAEGRRRTGRP